MVTAAMDEMLDLFCEMRFMRKTTTAYTFGNCGVFVYHVFDEFKKAIIDGLREGGLAVTYDRKCKLYRVESSGILVGAIE